VRPLVAAFKNVLLQTAIRLLL